MYTILQSALKAQFALTSKAHIVALPVALSVGFWIYLPALKYTVMEPDDKTNKQTKKYLHLKSPTAVLLPKMHDPLTQDNPQTLLQAVSCRNYVIICHFPCGKRASTHGADPS